MMVKDPSIGNSLYRWKTKNPMIDVKNEYFALPLNIAILTQNIDVVIVLLYYGADPLLRDSLGRYAKIYTEMRFSVLCLFCRRRTPRYLRNW
jgi:ankyrin repeat protein